MFSLSNMTPYDDLTSLRGRSKSVPLEIFSGIGNLLFEENQEIMQPGFGVGNSAENSLMEGGLFPRC